MITATGWTWEYIDENMNLYRLAAFTNHWLDCPPLHASFAGFMRGLSGKKKNPADTPDDEAMPDHARKRMGFPDPPKMPQQKGSRVEHMPDLPPEWKDPTHQYDAPDPKSPLFRRMFEGLGDIHIIKSKSPRGD